MYAGRLSYTYIIDYDDNVFYTPHTMKLLGGILVSLCPSVRLSVRPSVSPSVRPSVPPTSRVRSVASTVLVGSISYLYILSSNFKRCVACEVSSKNNKFEFLAIFMLLWLCLVLTWDLMWWWVSQSTGVLVVLVLFYEMIIWNHFTAIAMPYDA